MRWKYNITYKWALHSWVARDVTQWDKHTHVELSPFCAKSPLHFGYDTMSADQ